jgi:hypothetical protein
VPDTVAGILPDDSDVMRDVPPAQHQITEGGSARSFAKQLRADNLTPQQSPTCSTPLFFRVETGAGVLRFQDGSLLVVNVVKAPEGGICIDLAAGMARLTEIYEITRGTKRLKRASGTLTLTATVIPVLFNAAGGAQFLTITGKFEGTISGVAIEEDGRDERQ